MRESPELLRCASAELWGAAGHCPGPKELPGWSCPRLYPLCELEMLLPHCHSTTETPGAGAGVTWGSDRAPWPSNAGSEAQIPALVLGLQQ